MKNKILKYNAPVPRYTSYPTAPHFTALDPAAYETGLQALDPANPVSLYVHIPFCREMCWYCGCHTTATHKYAPVEDYTSLLLREIGLVGEKAGQRLRVSHLHFGGGSPSMLLADDFLRIIERLRHSFDFLPGAEIALEADPRGATHDKAAAYNQAGVTRASFGLQDFAPHVQAAINRVQSYDTVKKAVDLFHAFGIHDINFDLMYGLPKQGLADIEDSAHKALSLAPRRLALFGYAHVPWMKKHMRLIRDADLPDPGLRIDQFAAAERILTAAGMTLIGLDHFVSQDDSMLTAFHGRRLARNFQGYTTDGAETLLGFGMSSIGKTPWGFFQNHANITTYSKAILDKHIPVYRGCRITDEDRLRADIISSLMCYLDVDLAAMLKKHGRAEDGFDKTLEQMSDLVDDGLVTLDRRKITVSPLARQAVRVVAARFDSYHNPAPGKHAQAA